MLSPNTYLQKRYRIIRTLGKGGMGHVYEAIDDAVECLVAIKETLANSESLRRAFEREAKLLANLKHGVLPRVTHYFFEEERQYLVMDFIEGLNLAELLNLRNRPFTYQEILPWADELLKGLEYLHERSEPVIHRDIKPANIKLSKEGQIYLLDFGLAKGTAGQMALEEVGRRSPSIYGYTEAYGSPEQIENTGTSVQSDLYSLGATLYHLLTGHVPVSAPRRALKLMVGKSDPLLPADQINREVPTPLALVLSKAMALNQEDRIASASLMRQALQEAHRAIGTKSRSEFSAGEELLATRAPDELAWQETQPPAPVIQSPNPMSAQLEGALHPEPPVSSPPPVNSSSSRAEISWPSQVTSEAEGSEAAPISAEEVDAQRRAREMAEEETRLQQALDERQRAANLMLAGEEKRRREQADLSAHQEDETPALQKASAAVEPAVKRRSIFGRRTIVAGLIVLLVAVSAIFAMRYFFGVKNDALSRRSTPTVTVRLPGTRPSAQPTALNFKQELSGQRGVAWSVAFSPDGRQVASASEDKKIRVWDAQSWKLTRTLSGHEAGVNSIAFSTDGRIIASGSNDKTVRLSDVQNDRPAKTLAGHTDEIYFVTFSHDGRLLASAGKDRTIKLWDAQSEQALKTLNGHSDVIWAVAFSPDDKLLASASRDRSIKLWDAQSGKEVRTLSGHSKSVIALAFSPDGKILASGGNDRLIKLWDTETWQESRTLDGHQAYVTSLAFSPDGKLLASASNDKTVQLWDAESGESRQKLTGHSKGINAVNFSPDGSTLVTGSKDETVKVWQ